MTTNQKGAPARALSIPHPRRRRTIGRIRRSHREHLPRPLERTDHRQPAPDPPRRRPNRHRENRRRFRLPVRWASSFLPLSHSPPPPPSIISPPSPPPSSPPPPPCSPPPPPSPSPPPLPPAPSRRPLPPR